MVGQTAARLDLGARRTLSSLRESADAGRVEGHAMTQEEAVKRWTAHTYSLPFEDIDRVTFDVQFVTTSSSDTDSVQLEIDVIMANGVRHLFVRPVCEFGRIVGEILDLVDCAS